MILPKVRLTITKFNLALLKPGLDLLAVRLATADGGLYPHRNPWDRIDPRRCNVYPQKEFDSYMAGKILSVRKKLGNPTGSSKIYLDIFELAAAAFALRLFQATPENPYGAEARPSLGRKLEMYRKRAKRAARRKLGVAKFQEFSGKWKNFVDWSRYNLLHSRASKSHGFPHKRLWAERRAALSELIKAGLQERNHPIPNDSDMRRLVRLIKEEIRRGRHPVILTELLADTTTVGRDLLFGIVARKLGLNATTDGSVPLCVSASEVGERFMAARLRRLENRSVVPVENHTRQEAVPTQLQVPEVPSISIRPAEEIGDIYALTDANLADAMSTWLHTTVRNEEWANVTNNAMRGMLGNPYPHAVVPIQESVFSVIERLRPDTYRFNLRIQKHYVDFHGAWLVFWLYAYRADPRVVIEILKVGYRLARQKYVA